MDWIHAIAQVPQVSDLASLGVSGLMGAMWLWERRTSRQREQQLDEAHLRIMQDKVQLEQLIDVVRQNAEALSRFSATQEQLLRQLQGRGELAIARSAS